MKQIKYELMLNKNKLAGVGLLERFYLSISDDLDTDVAVIPLGDDCH